MEIATVVHTSLPTIPDPTLTGVAMLWTALEGTWHRRQERVRDAERELRRFRRPSVLSPDVTG